MKSKILYNKKIHDKLSRQYERDHVEIYNYVEQGRLKKTLKKALGYIKTESVDVNVLDFGCGAGNITAHLLSLGARVIAADISENFLNLVIKKYENKKYFVNLGALLLNGEDLSGVGKESFDMVVSYSVLHHIPNYLKSLEEMCRVIRQGGVLYIDHESSSSFWRNNPVYSNFLTLAKKSRGYKYWLDRLTHLFILRYWASLIGIMVNPRHKMEGDIHVFEDDHIEWDRIAKVLIECGFEIIVNEDYLLYSSHYSKNVYDKFKKRCSDTTLIIARKKFIKVG